MRQRRGCRYWLKLLSVGVIGGLLLTYLGFLIINAEILMQPAAERSDRTQLEDGFEYEGLTMRTV